MNAKFKEELITKELSHCTFKPQIINNYHSQREEVGLENSRVPRIEQLYKMGIQIIENKKDRPKHEIEVELYGKECVHQPNTKK